jgi:hypothetical protein
MLFLQIKNIYVNFSNYDLGHYIQSTEYEKKNMKFNSQSINYWWMKLKRKEKNFNYKKEFKK